MHRLKRLLTAFGIVSAMSFAFLGGTATMAVAQDMAPMAQADNHPVVLTPVAWTILTGLVMPFVIGLVTKVSSSAAFKGVMGILLAALAAFVERATMADGSAVLSAGLLLDTLMVYAPQLLTYLGVWRHVNLNSKLGPDKGLGG